MAKIMDNYTATMIAEGVEEADEATQIEAWQHLIDTGLAWQLQGSFGRQAMRMIEAGVCTPAGDKAAERKANADRVDGFDRDDLGESED